MRPIKFRAWDKENEVMVYPKGILFDGRVVNFSCGILEPFEGCELMQYTGLKDKNGKEIYEGDILKISNPYVGDIISEVVWGGAEYPAFDLPNYDGDTMNAFSAIQFNGEDEMEVIGNIYENPELLEGEK